MLTRSEQGHADNEVAGRRVDEARAGAVVLALTGIEFADLPDTRLSRHREDLQRAIEQTVRRVQPDVVFTHTTHDLHSDHRAVAEATREAGARRLHHTTEQRRPDTKRCQSGSAAAGGVPGV